MSTLQRILFNGVPAWKSADGNLYYYENSTQPQGDQRILLGTEAGGLRPEWKELLDSRLKTYRETQEIRARATKK
jgi:hypothetical protein